MRLGGWESLDMVLRYTRSVKFEESLRLYREMEGAGKQHYCVEALQYRYMYFKTTVSDFLCIRNLTSLILH